MATTDLGTRLTERNRKAQLAIVAKALKEFLKLWPLLDIERLDETAPGWIDQVVQLILQYRVESAVGMGEYYSAFKTAETGAIAAARDILTPPVELGALRTSLFVTGPLQVLKGVKAGKPIEDARKTAFVTSSKALQRHVLDAGRETIDEVTRSDVDAEGWARITDGDPCYFCALLASRGFVYHSKTSALTTGGRRGGRSTGQTFHDGCGCSAEPAFQRGLDPPGRGLEFEQIYMDSTRGTSGKESLRAFRRAYDAQR